MSKECQHKITGVTDSRPPSHYKNNRYAGNIQTVRRRQCQQCGYKFNTIEIAENEFAEMADRIRNAVLEQVIAELNRKKIYPEHKEAISATPQTVSGS